MDKEIEPKKMETKEDCLDSNDEDISESFICCVCLDLLYKPIVLACGHVSCFWCVHMSMSGLGDSSCPVCRHSYHHFPTICETLHFLIVKMYPNAYNRRETHMLEEEEKMDSFSPKFDINSLKSNSVGDSACSSVAIEENNLSQTNCSGTLNRISIADVLCPTCKNLLFRPVVLNCGHSTFSIPKLLMFVLAIKFIFYLTCGALYIMFLVVNLLCAAYCETCITIPGDELNICSICKSPHPSDFPKVCVELNNFLEKTFPDDYMARRDSIERQRADHQQQPSVASSSRKKSDRKDLFHFVEYGAKVHIGAGCDYCGVYPIIGTRFRCKDCKERVGFDLCERCYNTQSKLPGRFNQQHTAEHKFEVLLTSEQTQELLWRSGLLEDATEESLEIGTNFTMEYVVFPPENSDNNEDGSAESNIESAGDQSNDIQ